MASGFPTFLFRGLAVKREAIALDLIRLTFVALSLPARAQVSFLQPPTYSGSGVNQFVADFNGDGKPDILNSDGTMNLGNGDGTFTLGTSLSGTSVPVLAVADFNGDGKPDVLEGGTDTLLVLLGNGDGTFQAPISTTSNASFSVVAATDLNGDGKADVVGVFGSSLMVYISNGNGSFASGVSYNLGATASGQTLLSFGDFNGDTNTDVVLSSGVNGGQEIVLLGNGDGTFQTTPKTSVGFSYPQNAAVGDFNGDGKLDLAVSNFEVCNGTCTIPATTYVLLGNGDGTFQAPATAFLGDGPLAAADLNGDGKLDLVLISDDTGQIYLGNGDGTFSNTNNYGIALNQSNRYGSGFPAISLADFTGNGNLDIAAGGVFTDGDVAAAGGVLLGNGDGTFQGIQLAIAPTSPTAALVGAFENKGTLDVATLSSQSLYIFSNNGSGVLSLIHTYPLQQAGNAVVTADFNGDGNLDLLAVGNVPTTTNWGYSVLLGNGDGSFQTPVYYPQSSVLDGDWVVVADFNNDQKPDFAVEAGDQSVAVLLGNGDGTFASPIYYYDVGLTGPLVVADFNGDGKLDIAAEGGGTTGILYGNGDGTFQAMIFPPSLNGFAAEFTADVNNDGKPDLVSSSGQVALGNGDGTFTLISGPGSGLNGFSYGVGAVADLNGDGKLDELVSYDIDGGGDGYPVVATGVLLGNGDGTFGPLIDVPTDGTLPLGSALIADMNGDGRPDIVFAWGGGPPTGMAVLFNTTPPGFGVLASALSPSPVAAGNSAASTVTVAPAFGFNGTVALSCTGLPSGATCAFNPPSVANSSGVSSLTVTTSASLAAGTYPVQIQGTSGSIVNSKPVSLIVQAAPGFSLGASSGSPTSQSISAGQTANFSLAIGPTGSFTGTVDLSCAITPAVTPPPTCALSSSSVQISGSGTQTVTVNVGTTAPVTAAATSPMSFPPGMMPLTWLLLLLGSTWLWVRNRKRLTVLVAPIVVLALALLMSCRGSGSSSTHTTPGTPSGTYAVTITATSGSISNNVALQVVVQ